jgi:hypothetical protein
MRGEANVPLDWFGQLKPEVGQELDIVVKARVTKIEQENIDIRYYEQPPQEADTLGGEIRVTLILSQMRVPLSELERMLT